MEDKMSIPAYMLCCIGLICFVIGACMMDSPEARIPIVLILLGGMIFLGGYALYQKENKK